jgi:hypothetical protein
LIRRHNVELISIRKSLILIGMRNLVFIQILDL